jgi:hypothetical protein
MAAERPALASLAQQPEQPEVIAGVDLLAVDDLGDEEAQETQELEVFLGGAGVQELRSGAALVGGHLVEGLLDGLGGLLVGVRLDAVEDALDDLEGEELGALELLDGLDALDEAHVVEGHVLACAHVRLRQEPLADVVLDGGRRNLAQAREHRHLDKLVAGGGGIGRHRSALVTRSTPGKQAPCGFNLPQRAIKRVLVAGQARATPSAGRSLR